jgi:hypothetical protein
VEQYLQQADDPRLVDFDAGITYRADGDEQGQAIGDAEVHSMIVNRSGPTDLIHDFTRRLPTSTSTGEFKSCSTSGVGTAAGKATIQLSAAWVAARDVQIPVQ